MVDAEGLSVSVETEDGDTKVFDFRSADAPPDLVRPLVAAFAKLSGPAGTWGQMASVSQRPERTAAFPEVRRRKAPEGDHDHGPDRRCVEQLAFEHRYAFRLEWFIRDAPDAASQY